MCDPYILAWEFVTPSCLKPQNPSSNHEIHVLFEHGFYLKKLNWALMCMHDITLESVAAMTDRFTDVFVREYVACIYLTFWRRNDVRKFDADAILF